MPTLDLTPEEAQLLKEYMQADLSDLRFGTGGEGVLCMKGAVQTCEGVNRE